MKREKGNKEEIGKGQKRWKRSCGGKNGEKWCRMSTKCGKTAATECQISSTQELIPYGDVCAVNAVC